MQHYGHGNCRALEGLSEPSKALHVRRRGRSALGQGALGRLRNRQLREPLMTPEEHDELSDRLRDLRREKRQGHHRRRCIVFFGDGQYGHLRGHAAVPKKSLLKQLGIRTPTLLIDESYTSKMCPCGRELTNASSAHRVRVHKDGGGDCAALQCGICDRDELATLNIAHAALTCVAGQAWPCHLRRRPI